MEKIESLNGNIMKIGKNSSVSKTAIVENGAIIGDNCKIEGTSHIFAGAKIENSTIINSTIKEKAIISNSIITDSYIGEKTNVGPFTHIRGGAKIGKECKIGNFVEVKNCKIKDRTKACHLAYLGDAEIGEDCNIGCGVIFANYDGLEKYKTIVGDRVFIGCNSTIIAPCTLEDECFIAAGSTITKQVDKRGLGIARARQENKEAFYNPYLENFKRAKIYFGTDGIRGVVDSELTEDLAYSTGNALCQLKENPKVIIGRDTRPSGEKISKAIIQGLINGGAEVFNVGIVPTSAISYLTKKLGLDYGIVITASHNPKEYNGIKVFGNSGVKITDAEEIKIESKLKSEISSPGGKVLNLSAEVKAYDEFLKNSIKTNLNGLKILLDCANGASSKIAPKIFKMLGADVKAINIKGEINNNCGATHIENLIANMEGFDLGFSFDGDSDRVICVDKNKNIFDGDKIIYLLSLYKKKNGEEIHDVVGTVMTNKKIEELLKENGISLIRTPVGDKYIIEEMLKNGEKIGGEQAGHIIIGDKHITGDGILCAIMLSEIYKEDEKLFEDVVNIKTYPQATEEIKTKNFRAKNILKEENVVKAIEKAKKNARVVVRPSGTEPKIRIMVEAEENAENYAKNIKLEIEKIIETMAEN